MIKEVITERDFLEKEIAEWVRSPERSAMLTGERYYKGQHDVLKRERTVISEGGQRQAVPTLKNKKIVDNQYGKAVDQKANYLLGKPVTFDTDSTIIQSAVGEIFGRGFQSLLKGVGVDALNQGIAWLGVFWDNGKIRLKRFKGYEILPFWKNSEHTELDMAVRLYEKEVYRNGRLVTELFAEVYKTEGIERYLVNGGRLQPLEEFFVPYITDGEQNYSWGRVPIIAFKYNSGEIPLINKVKSLQDGLNELISDYHNNMSEDVHNTVLVLKNYEGENLGEFRHNLATYGAVKVKSVDGREGGIETLRIEVNSDNYIAIINLLKRAIVENAMSFDAKGISSVGTPNQMNLLSMYSDIELDANNMELEFGAALEMLFGFVKSYLSVSDKVRIGFIFNRDMLMNEGDIISNIVKSEGILSRETLISQHPWVSDVKLELMRLQNEGL